jgi:hypothetical protein
VSLSELSTPDVDKSGRFYSGLFGWAERPGESAALPYKTFWLGEQIVAGMLQGNGTSPASAQWTLYFTVSDASRTVEKATYLGALTVLPLREVPGVGRLAVLADPGGAVFAVIELLGGVVAESKESAETTVPTHLGTKPS